MFNNEGGQCKEPPLPDNECCQCGERGAVWNKHSNENREMSCPVPINWVCVNCDKHVCINCILTIPGSVPTEIYTPTYCSSVCRQAWLLRRKLSGEPTFDDTDAGRRAYATEDDGEY